MSAADSETERLDRAARDPAVSPVEAADAGRAGDLAGRTLGSFRVRSLLAQGGAGEVWQTSCAASCRAERRQPDRPGL
jgi:hypothetical protein